MTTLAGGAFITSINGKRCTAVPKAGAASTKANVNVAATTAAAVATADSNVQQFTVAASTAAIQDESSTSTSTSTTTSTSLSLSTSTSSPPPPPEAQVSAQVAPVAQESASESSTTLPTFSQIPTSPLQGLSSQTAVTSALILSSQTDNLNTAPSAAQITPDAAAASVQQGTALSDITSSQTLLLDTSAAALFTTIGTAPGPANSAAADATGSSTSTNGAVSAVPLPGNSNAIQSTVAVAGGVIGGVLIISMVAFFGWWWRRRIVRKRRSTLLTPLTMDNNNSNSFNGPDEKGAYVINRGSIGPTPRAERFKAALGFQMRKINGSISSRIVALRNGVSGRGSPAPSVDMDRGNSQFIEPDSLNDANRLSSPAARNSPLAVLVTTKDRVKDWWTRVTADMAFNWRLSRRKNARNSDDLFGSSEKQAGGKNPPGTTPAFLTLLGMDDRELSREAQQRRMDPSRTQDGGSASSSDRFLGGLNLNFGGADDPFSDANAINAHISAKPAPLVVSQTGNPFSDANAIPASASVVQPKPGTYVAEMRRSRGQSVTAADRRPPSSAVRGSSVGGYRESGASVESFGTRRNKFRSDPFDLERPELLGRSTAGSMSSSAGATVGSSSRISGGVGTGDVRRPAGAHTRADSFTSKYSSGVSMADWSDPGPDVGPAARGWEGREQRESPTQGWRTRQEKEKRSSGGSQGSVGKAM